MDVKLSNCIASHGVKPFFPFRPDPSSFFKHTTFQPFHIFQVHSARLENNSISSTVQKRDDGSRDVAKQ